MPRKYRHSTLGVCVLTAFSLVCNISASNSSTAPALSALTCPDAAWELQNPLPQSNRLLAIWGSSATDIFAVGSRGTIVHFDGSHWVVMEPVTSAALSGVWGSAPNDVYAVGGTTSGGVILHYDGAAWTQVTTTPSFLNDVWGTSADDIFAVGNGGFVIHYDGVSWTTMESNTTADLQNAWASAPDDVFAVGWPNVIIHYDGTSWTQMDSGIEDYIYLDGIWGSAANDVYACGDEGTFLHYDGSTWDSLPGFGGSSYQFALWGFSSTDIFMAASGYVAHYDGSSWTWANPFPAWTNPWMFDVWGAAPDDVYAVGDLGAIVHWDGSAWAMVSSPYVRALNDVWGTSRSDVFAVGEGGAVLHHDGVSWETSRSGGVELEGVWGTSSTNVYAVGSLGKVYRFDGSSWTDLACPYTQTIFHGVWGASANDIYMVGASGRSTAAPQIVRYNGVSWTIVWSGLDVLCDVWGSSSTDVFVVGWGGLIVHCDGTGYAFMGSGTTATLESVWGSSATDVWAVGGRMSDRKGVILHYDGAGWTQVPIGTVRYLLHVSGSSATDVWAVGEFGLVLHFDGVAWSPVYPDLSVGSHLNGVWSYSGCGVFAVGEGGVVMHYGEPGSVPTFITFFDARAVGSEVHLSWNIAADAIVDGFRIHRTDDNGGGNVVLNRDALIPPAAREFIDRGAQPGMSYVYTLAVVGSDGEEVRSSPVGVVTAALSLTLSQNYPNPFNPTTRMRFTLPKKDHVTLRVYDAAGRFVRKLVDGTAGPGAETIEWDGRDERGRAVASGVYFARLSAGGKVLSKKMVLAR